MIGEGETLIDAYVQNAREIEFEKDLLNYKQAEKIKHNVVKERQHQINEYFSIDHIAKNHVKKTSINFDTIQNQKKRFHQQNENESCRCQIPQRLCQQIFTQVQKRLKNISQEKDLDYQLILINYIVEGCIQMFESDIKIHVLEKDLDLIKILKPDIMKSFQYFVEQEIGQQYEMNLIIAQNDCLKNRKTFEVMNKNDENQSAIGGVILSDLTGNIVFKNTFDARLNILKQISLPMIRTMIWYNEEDKLKG